MIIIYDFDGTLTPYSFPQYEILKRCGYTDEKLMKRIKEEILNGNVKDLYNAYYKVYKDIIYENNIPFTRDTVCIGANSVEFNKGVVEYFNKFQSSKTGIKHYIVTSGMKDYVEETAISKYVNGIYGITFKEKNGILSDIDTLVTPEKKVDIIQKIQEENDKNNKIIYFGDGLTDKFAFEYVHSIGGINIFILSDEKSKINYKKMNVDGIIDECFNADFRKGYKICKYIEEKSHIIY